MKKTVILLLFFSASASHACIVKPINDDAVESYAGAAIKVVAKVIRERQNPYISYTCNAAIVELSTWTDKHIHAHIRKDSVGLSFTTTF